MGKIAKTEQCPDCGDYFAPQGINWHRFMKHGIPVPGKKPEPEAVFAQEKNTEKTEVTPESEVEMKTEDNGNAETEVTETNTEETEQENQDIATLKQQVSELTETVAELQKAGMNQEKTEETPETQETMQYVPVPEVKDFIDHCESGSCEHHASDWNQVKQGIIEEAYKNIPGEVIPDAVIESEGLRRGFIPTKFTIPIS